MCSTTAAGVKETVTVTLSDRDVSEWDVVQKRWVVVVGEFMAYVGSSSQDIALSGSFQVKE